MTDHIAGLTKTTGRRRLFARSCRFAVLLCCSCYFFRPALSSLRYIIAVTTECRWTGR